MTDYALRLSEQEIARYRLMAESARAREADTWQLAGIVPGARVADVGCGPGALLPALSETVGESGAVEALDGDDDAVAAARALVDGAGLSNVTVRKGRAEATGLEEGVFDAVMMRHVLAHNGRIAHEIVQHLAGLLRPGGCVLLVDVDMTAMRLRPQDEAVQQLVEAYRRFQLKRGAALEVGLHLDELLEGARLDVLSYVGLADVMPLPPGVRGPAWAAREAMLDDGVVSAADLEAWGRRFDELEASGERVTVFAPRYLAVGRRT
ncbi:MAG TPA: methyltransferase domain-containing protein [Mycobacteriales bacterium]|nr:methyltransferase domain-containing protein [Mycobacteriales bacterium]